MTTPNDFDDLELDEAAAADVEGGADISAEQLARVRQSVASTARTAPSRTPTTGSGPAPGAPLNVTIKPPTNKDRFGG